MSGQIRIAIDRLFTLEEGDENLLRDHDRALCPTDNGAEIADAVMGSGSTTGRSTDKVSAP